MPGHPTGAMHSFAERLFFPVLSYNPEVDEVTGEYKMSLLGRRVPNAMIYTMGGTREVTESINYSVKLEEDSKFLEMLFGETETLCSYDTYQFSDYSKYDALEETEVRRAKQREEQFPKDLEVAYELGKRLVEKAREAR